jgi:nucleoside-diphosphate-sugar epimerase
VKIAVTGSSGFLGRAVVAELARLGYDVRAINRTGEKVFGANEIMASGDLLVAELLPLLSGCDAVINCAARVHVLHSEVREQAQKLFDQANVEFPLRLFEAARQSGLRRFVQLSSVAAIASISPPDEILCDFSEPCPTTPYGSSKLKADLGLEALGGGCLEHVSLRPPAIIGAGVGAWFAMLMRAARLGAPLPIGRVRNLRSFVSVNNVASAVASAVASGPTGSYVITDSEPISTAALYRTLLGIARCPDMVWDWPLPLVQWPVRLALGNRADSLLGNAAFDGSNFAQSFNWRPNGSLEDAMRSAMESMR